MLEKIFLLLKKHIFESANIKSYNYIILKWFVSIPKTIARSIQLSKPILGSASLLRFKVLVSGGTSFENACNCSKTGH